MPLFERLHDDGCARAKAGNRTLHFDHYCALIRLYLFNPVVRSLRALQQASELAKVRHKLGCSRASLGSVDPTPCEDNEFTTPGDWGEQNRMDLLTVLLHEVGYLLGQNQEADGLRAETLTAFSRKVVLPGGDVHNPGYRSFHSSES